MKLIAFDHIVLTTADLAACLHFYRDLLNMRVEERAGRYALYFGSCKINIHTRPGEFQPAAARPTEGSIDLCLVTETPIAEAFAEMKSKGAPLVTDIVDRHGARGPMKSFYLRDPDGNLIEIANYLAPSLPDQPDPLSLDNEEEMADE